MHHPASEGSGSRSAVTGFQNKRMQTNTTSMSMGFYQDEKIMRFLALCRSRRHSQQHTDRLRRLWVPAVLPGGGTAQGLSTTKTFVGWLMCGWGWGARVHYPLVLGVVVMEKLEIWNTCLIGIICTQDIHASRSVYSVFPSLVVDSSLLHYSDNQSNSFRTFSLAFLFCR